MRSPPERMSILLVDDHPLFCDAMQMLCARQWPGLHFRSCGTLAQALDMVAVRQPDLLLLDLRLADAQGLDALLRLREAAPDAPVVVISADDRPATVTQAIEAGASGYIAKTSEARSIGQALQTVMDGGVCAPVTALGDVQDTVAQRRDHASALLRELSARQVDVLRLLVQGKSNKLISRDLQLSEATVKTHIAAVFRKLGVNNRTQAVLAAARLGLRLNAQAEGSA